MVITYINKVLATKEDLHFFHYCLAIGKAEILTKKVDLVGDCIIKNFVVGY